MKVSFITTIRHNVGDDFVREGISYLLMKLDGNLDVSLIHKHIPLTARGRWTWYYDHGWSELLDRLPRPLGLFVSKQFDRLPLPALSDKILNTELLVQSGAPVYYIHGVHTCANNEWYGPLIERRWTRVRARVPLFNIAAGSNQPYCTRLEKFAGSPATLDYVRELFDRCDLTTLRDRFSSEVLKLVNREAPVLPCTSVFARRRFGLNAAEPGFVALNFMPGGGHYDLDQGINPSKWRKVFVGFARKLAREERCVVVCHNRKELLAAQRCLPEFERFHSPRHEDYLEFYSRAKFGVLNRVHAAFAIASFGRPSVVVGSDARAHMVEMIGLRHCFVGEATEDILFDEVSLLRKQLVDYHGYFEELVATTEATYLDLLRDALEARGLLRRSG